MAKVSLSERQIAEIVRCYDDPWYALESYAWLEREADMDSSIIPFEPLEKQRVILDSLYRRRNTLVNKSRRVGWSWINAFFAWWLINFHKGVKVLFLSRTEDDAQIILSKVKFIHNNLAWRGDGQDDHEIAPACPWLAGEIGTNSKSEFSRVWRNDQGDVSSESIVVSLTNNDNSGRGRGSTFILMDEFAFYDNAEAVWRSMSKTIIGGGWWAVGSSPNGIGNKFHWLVMNALNKNNTNYDFLEFHWSESWISEKEVESDKVNATSDDAGQEWELQFLSHGNTVFDQQKLAACYKPVEEFPEVQNEIDRFREQVLYGRPGEHIYISGADTTVGKMHKKSSEKDWNAFTAFSDTGIQVASYVDQSHISDWAGYLQELKDHNMWVDGKLTELHREFPGVMLIEEDGPGELTINNHRVPTDGVSSIIPYRSSGVGKYTAIQFLKTLVDKVQIVITCPETYRQMAIYQDNGPGKNRYSAPTGYNDDLVTAMFLGAIGLRDHSQNMIQWSGHFHGGARDSIRGVIGYDQRDKVEKILNRAKAIRGGPRVYEGVPEQAKRMTDLVDDENEYEFLSLQGAFEAPTLPEGWIDYV